MRGLDGDHGPAVMTGQIGMFEQAPVPKLTRAQALSHKWFGNRCPHCGASPGEPCKRMPKGEPAFTSIHGKRSRYNAPGENL